MILALTETQEGLWWGAVIGGFVGLLFPASAKAAAGTVDSYYSMKDRAITALQFDADSCFALFPKDTPVALLRPPLPGIVRFRVEPYSRTLPLAHDPGALYVWSDGSIQHHRGGCGW